MAGHSRRSFHPAAAAAQPASSASRGCLMKCPVPWEWVLWDLHDQVKNMKRYWKIKLFESAHLVDLSCNARSVKMQVQLTSYGFSRLRRWRWRHLLTVRRGTRRRSTLETVTSTAPTAQCHWRVTRSRTATSGIWRRSTTWFFLRRQTSILQEECIFINIIH